MATPRMFIVVYIARALALIRYCFSGSYRARAHARWKETPSHKIIYEVGTGLLGLVVMVAIVVLIYNARR